MKPIFRWTFGGTDIKRSYEITRFSMNSVMDLFEDKFKYFFLFNSCDLNKIKKLKDEFKNVEFVEQSWENCPINLLKSSTNYNGISYNGSFWKICPPRIDKRVHEIVCDNDLIFLKKPKLILDFLSQTKVNFLIQDTNPYMSVFQRFFHEEDCFNSGLYGLHPDYDFQEDLVINWKECLDLDKEKKFFDYSYEQGLICYTLYKTNHIIGESHKFCGLHAKKISSNCFDTNIIDKKRNSLFKIENSDVLDFVFKNAETVHFLESNRRKDHHSWSHFKLKYLQKYI